MKIVADYSGLEKLKRQLLKLASAKPDVEVGYFEDKKYGPENDNLHVATVAYLQEMGTDKIPQRPFFTLAVSDILVGDVNNAMCAEYGKAFSRLLKGGQISLKPIGNVLKERVEHHIASWGAGYENPTNSPTTVARKTFDKPLIDTRRMYTSVEVREKK